MRTQLVVTACGVLAVWVLLTSSTAFPQEATATKFDRDARALFGMLVESAKINFLMGREGFERLVESYHLTRTNGGQAFGSWWAEYEGENSTGELTTFASFPGTPDSKRNRFWVRFSPSTETPIPEALMSHLLSKAPKTEIFAGDTLRLQFPPETTSEGCWSQYSLTVRITTGALVTNTAEVQCPVK